MLILRSSSERNDAISLLFEMRNLLISPKAEPYRPQICVGSLYQWRDNTKFTAPVEEVS
jgi:hypothetical protein